MKTALILLCSLSCFGQIDLGSALQLKAQDRQLVVSNITYTVKYELKNTGFVFTPATSNGQPHYECTARIFAKGKGRKHKEKLIGEIETQWTEAGCFEDAPMFLVGRALKWTRYPDNSAGPGIHWVVSEHSMTTAKDKP